MPDVRLKKMMPWFSKKKIVFCNFPIRLVPIQDPSIKSHLDLSSEKSKSHFSKKKFRKIRENCENLGGGKCENFINYDIIKLLMLSSQSREFHKFFAPLIVGAMILPDFFFAKTPKKYETSRKSLRYANENFCIFCASMFVYYCK